MIRVAAWSGAIALAVGTFLLVTHETIVEKEGTGADRAILLWIAGLRTPRLTAVMVDLTALGSPTLVVLFTLVTFAILAVLRDGRGAAHLAVASVYPSDVVSGGSLGTAWALILAAGIAVTVGRGGN